MSEPRFILEHVAALLLAGVSSGALGRVLTGSLPFRGRLERSVFTTAIGLGVFGSAVHLLGLIGAIRPAAILLLLAAPFAILLARRARQTSPRHAPDRPAPDLLLLLLFGLLPAILLALYPPTEFDSTLYHLPFAKAFAREHRVVFLPTLRFPVFPQLVEMLYAGALSVSDDVSAQLIHFLCLTLSVLALVAWSRRVATERAGAWAAAAWLGSPIVLAAGAAAYVDVALALFGTLCLYAWSVWTETNDARWLLWSAVFAGFAASTKYQGLFFVAAIPTAVWISRPGAGRLALKHLAISTLVLAPFYARILGETGNPFFPFFSGWFGATAWSSPLDPTSAGGPLKALERLFLPGSVHPRKTTYSPFLLLVPPLLTGAAISNRRQRPMFALVLAFGACWYLVNPSPRYLFAIVPASTLAAAAFVDGFLRKRGIPRKIPQRAFMAALALLLLLPGNAWAWRRIWLQGPLPATPGARARYLDERVDVHSALRALNSRFGARYTVYCLHCESAAYFAEGTFLGDYFGPYRFSRVESALGDGRLLYETLRQMGVTHLLVRPEGGTVRVPDDPFFRELFDPMPAAPGTLLFALRPHPPSTATPPETPVSSRPLPATHS